VFESGIGNSFLRVRCEMNLVMNLLVFLT
jgi:hypothetical protein